jgi:hypothetical protein
VDLLDGMAHFIETAAREYPGFKRDNLLDDRIEFSGGGIKLTDEDSERGPSI